MARKHSHYGRKISDDFRTHLKSWRTRDEVKLTQAEAAPQLGLKCKCAAAYLSQIETGKKPVPEVVLLNVSKVYNIPEEEVLRQAYWPQLHLPFLTAMMGTNVLWEEIEDYLKELETEFKEEEKREILQYATFLLLRRRTVKVQK